MEIGKSGFGLFTLSLYKLSTIWREEIAAGFAVNHMALL